MYSFGTCLTRCRPSRTMFGKVMLWHLQVISLILPRRVNVRRKSAWYAKGGEQPDLSPEDAQVEDPSSRRVWRWLPLGWAY